MERNRRRCWTELTQNGSKMSSYADKEPTLEDVFMMVTKGLVT